MIAQIAARAEGHGRARSRRSKTCCSVDHSDVESARKLAALVEPLGDAARAEDAYRVSSPSIRSIGRAEASLGRLALKRKDAVTARARVPQRARHESARSRAGAHRTGRGAPGRRPERPKRRRRRSPRSRSRRRSSARRICCSRSLTPPSRRFHVSRFPRSRFVFGVPVRSSGFKVQGSGFGVHRCGSRFEAAQSRRSGGRLEPSCEPGSLTMNSTEAEP